MGSPPSGLSPLSDNALAVLERRYLRRDPSGGVERPEEMFRHVAVAVAAAEAEHGASPADVEAIAERFFQRMASLEFLPNSPTLMNAGRPLGQLAACFVVPVGDSTAEIFDAVRWAAQIQKTGGGTGFSFSRLRPAGDVVDSTGGVASGPVAFMQVFDVATEAIKQGGTRRGANMGVLRVDHPDILEFIALKLDPRAMRNFNLSVAVTEAFMRAIERGGSYELSNPRTGQAVRRLDARRVFDLIVNAAWTTGDPGLVFLDRINDANPTPSLGAIEATNPCGEQPLLPFESCTLGSVNLARFVTAGGSPEARVDWPRLREVIHDGVRFLDDVIDVNRYPLDEIAAATRATRKIGLGVMGFADMLIELGVPYDDERAVAIGAEVARLFERESLAASMALAERRGPFPAYGASSWASGRDPDATRPVRNATTTTVAPTGTISIIAGCSSGIEPLFAVAYRRHVLDGAVLPEIHPAFRARAEAAGVWSDELAATLAQRGRVRGLEVVPAALQRLFPTAHDLSAEVHLSMQATFQRHVHAAVSKTINLPHDARPADVAEAYRLADRLGCKGVTIYRDRSRDTQVLAFGEAVGSSPQPTGDTCPECGGVQVEYEGCRACRACGWSVCG
jgi:ribonucleoside-diphosphate reductase alpha chain